MIPIGTVRVSGRYVLAPLAGVNCTAFRLLCKENGAALIYTQMIDVDIINQKNTYEIERFLNIQPQEHPITIQLIGSKKESLIHAVRKVEPFADIIDLNIGCIEPDYIAKGTGAFLLKDPKKLEGLFTMIKQTTNKPVTAKIRIGWDSQSINAVKVSEILEQAGASAICIHGRTAEQKYAGKTNWTIMKQVKEKLNIPVIANGDITTLESGEVLLSKTGCDLVMIGREAMHRPWVFSNQSIDIKQQIFRFIDLYVEYEKRRSMRELTDHVYWMLRDYPTNMDTKRIHRMQSIAQVRRFVERLN